MEDMKQPRDPRVDQYIEQSEPFARPILLRLRSLVHTAVPDVEETLKWGFPHFMHRGMLCSMASFKWHCAFGFWKESMLLQGEAPSSREAMGQFGRIESLDDLPPDEVLLEYLRRAAQLNEAGISAPRGTSAEPRVEPAMHPEFAAALDLNPAARAVFDGFSPSARREYLEWIAEARRDATRQRRVETALGWIAEGKQRNWKYMKR